MFERRDVLKLALAGLAAGADVFAAQADEPPPGFALGNPAPFSAGMVVDAARALAKQPFKAPSSDIPGPLRNLAYDQYVAIRNQHSLSDPGGVRDHRDSGSGGCRTNAGGYVPVDEHPGGGCSNVLRGHAS